MSVQPTCTPVCVCCCVHYIHMGMSYQLYNYCTIQCVHVLCLLVVLVMLCVMATLVTAQDII